MPEGFLVTAPDGIPVRVLPLAGNAFMGAAVGYLAPGVSYGVHFHNALEQLSFVVKGQVLVTMHPPDSAEPTTTLVRAGDAITNPPGVTLSFANQGPEPAEVLFVCAPPFPGEGVEDECVVVDEHRTLNEEERAKARTRASWALGHFRSAMEQRIGR